MNNGKILMSRQLKNPKYLIAEDFVCSIDKNDQPVYREAILTIKDIVEEDVVDMEKVKNKNRKFDDVITKKAWHFYFTENGVDLKPYVLTAEVCRKGLESSCGTKVVDRWIGKQTMLWIEKNVYMPGTKKADKITTDAIRFKRIPQRMCEVCGKVIAEKIYQASINKYKRAFCSAECKEKGEK